MDDRLGGRIAVLVLMAGSIVVCPEATSAQVPPAPLAVTRTATALAGRLDGLVTDQRGAPLPGVAITAQGSQLQFAVTDDHGRFSFYSLRPGPYLVRAVLPGHVSSKRELVQVLPTQPSWQAFRLSRAAAADVVAAERPVVAADVTGAPPSGDQPGAHEHSPIAWRLRHLTRSVLREQDATPVEVARDADSFDAWLAGQELARLAPAGSSSSVGAATAGWLPGLALSGQFQLLTASNFDSPEELFSSPTPPAGIAYIAIGAPAGADANWSAQAAVAQGELSSWAFAGTYSSAIANSHVLDVAIAYGLQRYEGANPLALAATAMGDRSAGAVTVSDRWSFADGASVTLGTRYSRYGYVDGPAMWSPSAHVRWEAFERLWVRVLASQQMTAPGAEEFVPSPVGGLWMPAQRTFSPVFSDAVFRPERTRHAEVAVDREFGSFVLSAKGFRQRVDDQVVTLFGVQLEDRPRADLGHYYVANGGDFTASGWGVSLSRPMASRLRGELAYTMTSANWVGAPSTRWASGWAPSALRPAFERLHDVTTTVETDIAETATRVFAVYRLSTGFARASLAESAPGFDARFDVQISQRLPFLDFTAAEWEVLVAVRNLFRETVEGMSVYDELLVVRPPKRIVGGFLVRF